MHPPFHRSLAFSLALCAMLVRAVLPAGWMPNPAADAAASPFIICSVDGTHGAGKAPSDSTGERTHAPCAFAAVAHLAPPTLAPGQLFEPSYLCRVEAAPDQTRVDASTTHRPQTARAPPAFS